MSKDWRLSFMFDAPGGDVDALAERLAAAGDAIRSLAGEAHLRLGVADRHPDLSWLSDRPHDTSHWRTADGAVEITVDAARRDELAAITRSLRATLTDLAAASSIEVMAGPVFYMVPRRDGGAFLSLAFSRYPGTTSQQFRDWWFHQHSKVAIPVLGEDLYAYDQVHLDAEATAQVAAALGVSPTPYDAYDNLTYIDRNGFLRTLSDVEGMARIQADEVERIDNTTRRHALMREIG